MEKRLTWRDLIDLSDLAQDRPETALVVEKAQPQGHPTSPTEKPPQK